MTLATRSNNAFTLVELVLVMLICALLAALVFPAVRNAWGSSADTAARNDLVRLLRQARLAAIDTGRPHTVSFTKTDDGYIPVVQVDDQPVAEDWAKIASPLPAAKIVQLSDGNVVKAVVFTPKGVQQNAQIVLADSDGFNLTISAPTGSIHIVPAGQDAASLNKQKEQAAVFWQDHCRKAGQQ